MQEFINDLANLNIKVQFGHTLADFSCCDKIMKDYEVGFTHLYNAMSGNDHRSPGVLSAALSKGKYAEIICDNIHVTKEAIKNTKKSNFYLLFLLGLFLLVVGLEPPAFLSL